MVSTRGWMGVNVSKLLRDSGAEGAAAAECGSLEDRARVPVSLSACL